MAEASEESGENLTYIHIAIRLIQIISLKIEMHKGQSRARKGGGGRVVIRSVLVQ